jgi:hypothetical protein
MTSVLLQSPFGRAKLSVRAPASNLLEVLTPQEGFQVFDEAVLLHEAIEAKRRGC